MLRDARSLMLRDAESFHTAARVLEDVGRIHGSKSKSGLGAYKDVLLPMVNRSCVDLNSAERLFSAIKSARNKAVHEGAWARHLSSRLIDFILLLEKSVIMEMHNAGDIMVRNPLIVESWHMLHHIRREMLANSYSFIPIKIESSWRMISDYELLKCFHRNPDSGKAAELKWESREAGAAINAGHLVVNSVICCGISTPISDLSSLFTGEPILVTHNEDDTGNVLGIITPFDLL